MAGRKHARTVSRNGRLVLFQFWGSTHLRALLGTIAEREGVTNSHLLRAALWERLRRTATRAELDEYRSSLGEPN